MRNGDQNMKVRLAAVQMVSGPDVAANLGTAERLIGEAAQQGAQLVLLPEYFCLMGSQDRDKLGIMEADAGDAFPVTGEAPLQAFLAEMAHRYGLVLVGGTVPLRSPKINRVCNSCLVHGPDGRRLARYDKIHLFGFRKGEESYDESLSIFPGRTPVVVDVPVPEGADNASLRVGLSVCYDLRFPELYRQMAPLDLIVMPAAFTHTTGRAHWEMLLRARAVENQCYVLAAGQGGEHPSGRRTWGHSMLVDPWGEILAVLPEGEGVVLAELDTDHMASVRENLPALRHRVI